MTSDVSWQYLGFLVTQFEPQEPPQHVAAVHRMVRNVSGHISRLVRLPVPGERRKISRAHQYAKAWAKVNARFVPRNVMEDRLLKAGRQIEQHYRQVAARMTTRHRHPIVL